MPPFTHPLIDRDELDSLQLDTIRKDGSLDIHESSGEGHAWIEYYNYRVVDGIELIDVWFHFNFRCTPIPIRCPVCNLPISTRYEEHCTCSESDWRST